MLSMSQRELFSLYRNLGITTVYIDSLSETILRKHNFHTVAVQRLNKIICSKLILKHWFSTISNRKYCSVQHHALSSKINKTFPWIVPEGYNTDIKIFNTLTGQKEELILPTKDILTWYSCGPTVYDHAHIGHASSYVRMDIIRRILQNFFHINVIMAMGVTDIDDKIIFRSKELAVDWQRLAKNYEMSFFRDLEKLRVLPPNVKLRVTDHIPDIVLFIKQIMKNGYAYRVSSGSVYFDVPKYGKSGRLVRVGEHEEYEPTNPEKHDPRDFALWKAAKPGEPYWESPFGNGRPGWHIECSAMSSRLFGEQLDLHSGGEDLMFPHHENEIAQSETCFGCQQWTNYWLHTGHLHISNQQVKMSKSLKNTISVSQLLSTYTANQFRMFCMLRPYRHGIEYSDDTMQKAVQITKSWYSFLTAAKGYVNGEFSSQPVNDQYIFFSIQEARSKVGRALRDDFDTPRAVFILEELVKRCNIELCKPPKKQVYGARSTASMAAAINYLENILTILGFSLTNQNEALDNEKVRTIIDTAVKFRGDVRKFVIKGPTSDVNTCETTAADFKRKRIKENAPLMEACDTFRDDFKACGIQIHDHRDKCTWEVQTKTEAQNPQIPSPVKKST